MYPSPDFPKIRFHFLRAENSSTFCHVPVQSYLLTIILSFLDVGIAMGPALPSFPLFLVVGASVGRAEAVVVGCRISGSWLFCLGLEASVLLLVISAWEMRSAAGEQDRMCVENIKPHCCHHKYMIYKTHTSKPYAQGNVKIHILSYLCLEICLTFGLLCYWTELCHFLFFDDRVKIIDLIVQVLVVCPFT